MYLFRPKLSETEFLLDVRHTHGIRQVLLVGKNEQYGIP